MYFTLTICFLGLLIYLNKDTFANIKNKKNKFKKKFNEKTLINKFNNKRIIKKKVYMYRGIVKEKKIDKCPKGYEYNVKIELTIDDEKHTGYKKKKLLHLFSKEVYDLYSLGDEIKFEEINTLDKNRKINKSYISKEEGFKGEYKIVEMDLIFNREELLKNRQYRNQINKPFENRRKYAFGKVEYLK